VRRGPLTGAEQGPSRNSSTNCMCPATEKSGPSPSVAHTSSPSRVGEPSRQQHTQMATGSSTAMSMWARPGPGQPGSGGAGTAPSPVRRSRAYCAGARCVPPPSSLSPSVRDKRELCCLATLNGGGRQMDSSVSKRTNA